MRPSPPVLAVPLVVLLLASAPLGAQNAERDALLETLERGGDVEGTALARLVFGTSAQLLGGVENVGLLRGRVVPRDPAQAAIVDVAAGRFDEYRAAVDAFRDSAAALLDAPGSPSGLHEALTDGQRACWLLDRYSRLVETYGASSADMMGILTSIEACVAVRRAAFASGVRGIVADALGERDAARAEAARLRREVADLELELRELEALLQDLMEIDEAP